MFNQQELFDMWVIRLLAHREYNKPNSEEPIEVEVKELPSWFKK